MPRRRRRSLAGPVVLIFIGIVFLMGTMGVLHWHVLGTVFAHYWPVLIILWGVVKLLEHQQAQRAGERPSGIGVGGVFLLVFLIVAGLIATQASRVNWSTLRDQWGWDAGDFDNMFGSTFSYNDQITQAFPAGASLHVVSDRGSVRLVTSSDNQIKITINKKIHADNQENADKYNQSTKPQVTTIEKVVTLNANTQGAGEHGVSTDMTISVPRKAAVVISTRRGDVTVTGRDGNIDISSQRGDALVEDVHGNAHLSLDHSSGKASNIAGDVTIEGHANDVTVSDVKGAARLNGEFMESVKLSHIAKTVTFKSSRTDLEFSRIEGTLDLDSGDLRASSAFGPGRLITQSKDITLDGISGDLRVEDSNGAVQVNVSKMGNLDLSNRDGAIQLSLPPQAAFRLDAHARNGTIQSDFAEIKINNDDVATAGGSVGNGSTMVRINCQDGTIEIHKGKVEAMTAPPAPKAPHLPAPADDSAEPRDN